MQPRASALCVALASVALCASGPPVDSTGHPYRQHAALPPQWPMPPPQGSTAMPLESHARATAPRRSKLGPAWIVSKQRFAREQRMAARERRTAGSLEARRLELSADPSRIVEPGSAAASAPMDVEGARAVSLQASYAVIPDPNHMQSNLSKGVADYPTGPAFNNMSKAVDQASSSVETMPKNDFTDQLNTSEALDALKKAKEQIKEVNQTVEEGKANISKAIANATIDNKTLSDLSKARDIANDALAKAKAGNLSEIDGLKDLKDMIDQATDNASKLNDTVRQQVGGKVAEQSPCSTATAMAKNLTEAALNKSAAAKAWVEQNATDAVMKSAAAADSYMKTNGTAALNNSNLPQAFIDAAIKKAMASNITDYGKNLTEAAQKQAAKAHDLVGANLTDYVMSKAKEADEAACNLTKKLFGEPPALSPPSPPKPTSPPGEEGSGPGFDGGEVEDPMPPMPPPFPPKTPLSSPPPPPPPVGTPKTSPASSPLPAPPYTPPLASPPPQPFRPPTPTPAPGAPGQSPPPLVPPMQLSPPPPAVCAESGPTLGPCSYMVCDAPAESAVSPDVKCGDNETLVYGDGPHETGVAENGEPTCCPRQCAFTCKAVASPPPPYRGEVPPEDCTCCTQTFEKLHAYCQSQEPFGIEADLELARFSCEMQVEPCCRPICEERLHGLRDSESSCSEPCACLPSSPCGTCEVPPPAPPSPSPPTCKELEPSECKGTLRRLRMLCYASAPTDVAEPCTDCEASDGVRLKLPQVFEPVCEKPLTSQLELAPQFATRPPVSTSRPHEPCEGCASNATVQRNIGSLGVLPADECFEVLDYLLLEFPRLCDFFSPRPENASHDCNECPCLPLSYNSPPPPPPPPPLPEEEPCDKPPPPPLLVGELGSLYGSLF